MKASSPKRKLLFLNAFRLIVFLIVLEFLLRLLGNYKTQTEIYTGTYQYFFENKVYSSWFHTFKPNSSSYYGNTEFQEINHYNDLGQREKSFASFKKDTSSIKIVCLGDSFTEGDGATYDSTWVRYVEAQLNSGGDCFNVYNAGVCGSDVFYNYIMLKEKLLESKPSYVIECINNSDLTDVYYRGDLARFNEDGTLNSPNFKAWEVFFKYSHAIRFIISVFTPYDHNLVKRKDELETKVTIAEQIKKTQAFCKNNNIKYTLVIMPTAYEIKNADSEFRFENFHLILNNRVAYINIFDCMENKFPNQEIDAYYWLNDGHYNGKGYYEMGKCIMEELKL